jgi:hypothetical protein
MSWSTDGDVMDYEETSWELIAVAMVRYLDPIPGPETIGPSLEGPDYGVYQHEVRELSD